MRLEYKRNPAPLESQALWTPFASGFGWVTLSLMRVFGIDCGTEITGFGVVDSDEQSRMPRLTCQAFGAIRLSKQKTMAQRLKQVFDELSAALEL